MLCGKQPQQSHFVLNTAPDTTKSTRTGTANRGQFTTTANGAQSAQSATHVQEAVDIL